ncbi:hypothetical protein SK128_017780 [Halocaridina rubra]|uniref:Uncharacterized protein n=1 Tax=Halocaridina rubra TaxID=373956 RepID=A0AAN8XNR5_HALRR
MTMIEQFLNELGTFDCYFLSNLLSFKYWSTTSGLQIPCCDKIIKFSEFVKFHKFLCGTVTENNKSFIQDDIITSSLFANLQE